MATIEQVEKLREKANITYDEAKTALDASGDDMLEAMIYLERMGKVMPPQNGGYYNSKSQAECEKESKCNNGEKNTRNRETFSQGVGRFFRWCGRLIAKGNENIFEVRRNDQIIISIPVTILVLLLIFAFWVVVPLIVIGLFFGYRYIFRGSDLEKTGVNHVMDSAADAAENLKKEVKEGHDTK
ncbi:MAG: DUF4342 domain-containing protein [Clostridia bacterium]